MRAETLAGDPLSVAARLLGATLSAGGVSVRIVEVEAYGGPSAGPFPDAASHAYRGVTARNAVMSGPPGRLYVYRSHGIHFCANISCGPDGTAAAVLLRAAAVDTGEVTARSRRGPAPARHQLARGPGNLCAALGISTDHNGAEVFAAASPVRLRLGLPAAEFAEGPRVGVSAAADRHWRLWLPGHPAVSAYRRSPRAPLPGCSD